MSRCIQGFLFHLLHSTQLIYNTSWEDSRIDRRLLCIDSTSSIVAITSAGCNILDYALDSPRVIHAVDVNPRQNYLLELKKALIQHSSFDDLFQFFGVGSHPRRRSILSSISPFLRPECLTYWVRNINLFSPGGFRPSFYWRGTAGTLAWLISIILRVLPVNIQALARSFFSSRSLNEQEQIYSYVESYIWTPFIKSIVANPVLLLLAGVPPQQIATIRENYGGGILAYIRDKFSYVMTKVPAIDNFYWHVYAFGCYSISCCPSYLRPQNKALLSEVLNRVFCHDTSVSDFLECNPGQYTHFVLLDHLDWLAANRDSELHREWNLILANSVPGTLILFRSAGNGSGIVPENLRKHFKQPYESEKLGHAFDRVGTYASLHVLEVI